MRAFYSVAVGLAGFFLFGVYLSQSSKNFPNENTFLLTNRATRDPAAIKRVYDFSNLEGSALSFAAKQRLLEGVKVLREESDLGLELGHFVIKGPDGNKTFACQTFSKLVLSFEGDGVAVAGELPQMEVEGRCEIAPDINRISAVWIPVSKILGEPVSDGEFDYREGKYSKLKFTNVSDQWPRTWRLKTVRLVDPTGEKPEVAIPTKELDQIFKTPFIIKF